MLARCVKLVRDLFMGPGNTYWDYARIASAFAMTAMIGAAGWNIWLGLPIDLGPAGLGGGLTGVIGAIAAFVYAKDRMHVAAENMLTVRQQSRKRRAKP